MPYEIPTLGKLIADGEKDIAYELGLQKLPPVSVEQALNVSFSSQVRDLYDHQSWIKDQIIPSTASDDETIIKTATYEGVIRKQATFASGPVTFTSQSPIPAETRMQSDTNQVYQVLTSGEVQDGEVTVIVQAEETGRHRGLAGTGQTEETRPVHPSDTGQPGEQERRPGKPDRITENAGPRSDAAGVLAAHGHRYDVRHRGLLPEHRGRHHQ